MTTDKTNATAVGGSALSEGLGPLPDPDLLMPSVMSDGPDGAHYYRASTVLRLLAAERERLLAELRTMHAQQNGRHNHYLYTAELLAGKL